MTKGAEKEVKLVEALELVKGKSKASAKEIVQNLKSPQTKKPEQKRILLSFNEEEYALIQEVSKLRNKEAKELLLSKCKEEKKKLEKEQTQKITKSTSRHILIKIKREVLKRANFKCEHSGCPSKRHLEYAHITAYSKGGKHTKENIKLLCHAHHKYETFKEFSRRPNE